MTQRIRKISPKRAAAMHGVTWHPELKPPPLDDLCLVAIPHWTFSGTPDIGELVTTWELSESIAAIFNELYRLRFPIQSIRAMVHFGGDDAQSMAANNTSCFNSREILHSTRISAHSYGRAIDVNPVQNPVVRDGVIRPPKGAAYLDRNHVRPGMFVEHSPQLLAFTNAGWEWGGRWTNPKDYHHFYLSSPDD